MLINKHMVVQIRNQNDVTKMQTFAFPLHLQARRLGGLIAAMCLLAGIFTLQAQNDKKADDAYLGANALFNLRLYEQAIGSYQEFLKNNPKHPKVINVRYGMGISHFQLKQYDKAVVLLSQVAGDPKAPDVPRANLFWGQSLLMLGKPANAEGAFAAGIKALPKDTKETALRANLQVSQLEALFQQKKWKGVVDAAKSLKGKVGNRSTRVGFQGAFALYELKQFKDAGNALTSLKPSVKGTAYEQQTHFLLAESLRDALPWLRLRVHAGGGSFKSQFKKADRSGARLALVFADDEAADDTIQIKPLAEAREQERVALAEAGERIAAMLEPSRTK